MIRGGGLILLLVLFLGGPTQAQLNSYFVSFTDKDNTPYSITAPEGFLTQRAVDRRIKQGIAVLEEDLPVTPTYVIGLENTGSVSVRYTSRWFNGAIIQATSTDAESIKLLPFVADVEYVAPSNVGGRIAGNSKYENSGLPLSDSLTQFEVLGVNEMRMAGYQGEGMMVAVIDGGFVGVNSVLAFDHLYSDNQVISTFDFISGTSDVYQYSSHGTEVLSLIGASQDSPEYRGIVPNANFVLMVTENAEANIEYRIEEYWWLVAAEKADSIGVDVINTSLGYYDFEDPTMNYTHDQLDGRTAVISRAAQKAANKGMLVVTSAGNTGNKPWEKVNFPADVIDGIAVGSLINEQTLSGFSAKGPTQDGRLKPDVVAIGSGAYVINSSGSIVNKSGTSFSSPMVAGLITGVWQAYPDLTVLELLEAVRESATNSFNPNNNFGYGIPSYRAMVNYIEHFEADSWVSIYPNPTIDDLTVAINDPSEDNRMELRLFNSQGQSMLVSNGSITWQNNKYILDVSTLPRGIYVLNLQSNDKFSQLKFAKL